MVVYVWFDCLKRGSEANNQSINADDQRELCLQSGLSNVVSLVLGRSIIEIHHCQLSLILPALDSWLLLLLMLPLIVNPLVMPLIQNYKTSINQSMVRSGDQSPPMIAASTDQTPQFHCWYMLMLMLLQLLLIDSLLLLLLLLLSIRRNMKTMTNQSSYADEFIVSAHQFFAASQQSEKNRSSAPLKRTESTTRLQHCVSSLAIAVKLLWDPSSSW